MGFKEIQAAFAANGTPPATATVAPDRFQPAAFTPSPFQPVAFTPPAAAPAPAAPVAPVQQAFTFVPPANAPTPPNGGPWSPINPPGERVALGQPQVAPAAQTEAPAAEPPKRKRRTKAEMAAAQVQAPAIADARDFLDELDDAARAVDLGSESAPIPHENCQADVRDAGLDDLKDLPADGSTVEDIVEELFARGVVKVNLTFTKDGR